MGPSRSCLNGDNKCIAARGDYFEGDYSSHVCTINKSTPTKKKSRNLFNDPCNSRESSLGNISMNLKDQPLGTLKNRCWVGKRYFQTC